MDKGPSNIFLFNIVKPELGSRAAAAESGLAAATRATCPGPRVPRLGTVEDTRGNCSLPPVGGAGGGDQPLTSIRYWAGPSPRDSNGISSHHRTPPPDLWQHCWRSHLSRYGRYTYSGHQVTRHQESRGLGTVGTAALTLLSWTSQYCSMISGIQTLVILRTQRLP